jgi:23S rRNA (uracil1939-C5)-methyltransferase
MDRGGSCTIGATSSRQYVLERVMRHEPATVVDGYAGLGDTAMPLAERGVRVTAIELDRAATAWCAARLASGSRAIAGRVEDELAASLPADVVLLNPPRAGVDARVAETLERAEPRPRAVLYVSCDPATLSRDVRRMPGYEIVSLVAFDMFPQTAHVETVCELAPREAEARPEPA